MSQAREQAIEVMAEALRRLQRGRSENDVTARQAGTYWIDKADDLATAAFDALLAARVSLSCGKCGGRGTDQSVVAVLKFTETGLLTDCPAGCANGRVESGSLLHTLAIQTAPR